MLAEGQWTDCVPMASNNEVKKETPTKHTQAGSRLPRHTMKISIFRVSSCWFLKCDLSKPSSTQTPRDTQPPPGTWRITSSLKNFMDSCFVYTLLHILSIAWIFWHFILHSTWNPLFFYSCFRLILTSSRMHWFSYCRRLLSHNKQKRRPCQNQVKSGVSCFKELSHRQMSFMQPENTKHEAISLT